MHQNSNTDADGTDVLSGGAEIGALLRATRMRRGEDLQDIAATLRIRPSYLDAIEDGRFDALPGATYTSGFIRAFGDYLGLDGGELVRRYKSAGETAPEQQKLSLPTPVPERGLPGGAVVMIGALIAALGYGGWYFYSTRDEVATEAVPPVPESLAPIADNGNAIGEARGANIPMTQPPAAAAATPVEGSTYEESDIMPQTADMPDADQPADAAQANAPAPAAVPSDVPQDNAQTAGEPAHRMAAAESKPPAAPGERDGQASATNAPAVKSAPAAKDEQTPPAAPATAMTAANDSPSASESERESALKVTPKEKPQEVAALGEQSKPTAKSGAKSAAKSVAKPDAKSQAEPVAEPVAKPMAKTAAVEPATASTAGTTDGRIEVRAKADSWIQVRDTKANQLVMTRLLRRGDVYRVPDREGLTLLTGNAGALEIMVDGKPVPAIGDVGAIRRQVRLEASQLRNGTAVVE